jgi:hypothetical protein
VGVWCGDLRMVERLRWPRGELLIRGLRWGVRRVEIRRL